MKLEIKDLHIEVDGKEIIKGISLIFEQGKTYALMGPNGSGKSSLSNALMGHPKYKITKGKIILNGKDITKKEANEKAKLGLFLAFQYPKEISGLSLVNFLRTSYNSINTEKLNPVKFHKLLKTKMDELKMNPAFRKRYVNEGFSGGEKKRSEILQLSLLEPKYAILDEIDSGLDIDALKIVCNMLNKIKENAVKNKKAVTEILITHYDRILKYIKPDKVFILFDGKIIKEGDKELASHIEKHGFENIIKEYEVNV